MKIRNAITDVPGIRVGHAQDYEALTGCTVILCEAGAVGGVDQRGGAPGTRETDALHPMHLVYNVPTLLRMRDEVGPILGANLDPSHLFWQLMDPVTVIRTLGPAIHHVHLKDTQLQPERLAIAGVLDPGGPGGHRERAWNFRTVGVGHDRSFWVPFLEALREVGYDDALSIENEDPFQTADEGVRDAASFILPLLAAGTPVAAPGPRTHP